MEICVIGTGYVGLVTGACFASVGNRVTCVDIDRAKIKRLNAGQIPIYEPGLEEVVASAIAEDRLHFTSNFGDGVPGADVIFLAVGTPSKPDGSADLRYVLTAARQVAEALTGYSIIVDKSTVPVGTADQVQNVIGEVTRHPFDVVSNPEFLKEGAAISDFLNPDRVVLGAASERPLGALRKLYEPFTRNAPLLTMDLRSAELSKYAANAMLATRISFMNEIANLCEKVGADIEQVREAVGLDNRIGRHFLNAGIGYGGSCFPKDVRALENLAAREGCQLPVVSAINQSNELQKGVLVEKVVDFFCSDRRSKAESVVGNGHPKVVSDPLAGRIVAAWGLSFKPGTDDIREAPALAVIGRLLELGAVVRAYDPEATATAWEVLQNDVSYGSEPYGILEGADALLVLTEWEHFRKPDFDRMKDLMNQPVIFDGRNVYDHAQLDRQGFVHFSIGRRQPSRLTRKRRDSLPPRAGWAKQGKYPFD